MALKPITRQEKIIAGKDLEPITRMEKFLKEYGGGGGNSAPPDYLAAEGEPGHILNRPFYEESTPATFVEERTFYAELNSELGVAMAEVPAEEVCSVGSSYDVIINGNLYKCVAWELDGGVAVGNGSIFGGEAGEDVPFLFVFFDSYCAALLAEPGEYTIKITGMKETVHKIHSKYLPTALETKPGVVSLYDILETVRPTQTFHVEVGKTTFDELSTFSYTHAIYPFSYGDTYYVGLNMSVYKSTSIAYAHIIALDERAIPCKIYIETESIPSDDDAPATKVATVNVTYPLGQP